MSSLVPTTESVPVPLPGEEVPLAGLLMRDSGVEVDVRARATRNPMNTTRPTAATSANGRKSECPASGGGGSGGSGGAVMGAEADGEDGGWSSGRHAMLC